MTYIESLLNQVIIHIIMVFDIIMVKKMLMAYMTIQG